MTGSCSILPALIELGEFQYCANEGNMGDLLIDMATRQFFRRHHLPVRHGSHHHVVYGGGGRFVPFYGSLEVQAAKLTSARVERCIILPHSFYQVDSFIHVLDERHLVFCREQRSLEYCRSLNERAQFLPADDMALHFCPDYSPPPDLEERGAPHCLKPWAVSLMGKIRKAVRESSFPVTYFSPLSKDRLALFLAAGGFSAAPGQGERSASRIGPGAGYFRSLEWHG